MALGAIIGGASAIGGLFGGGGARAPRMNGAQKELLRSQADLNRAQAERIRSGGNQCCKAQQGLFGNQCPQGHQMGPFGHQGMNGAQNGFGSGPMQKIFAGFGQMMDMQNGMGGFGGGGFNNGFGGGGFVAAEASVEASAEDLAADSAADSAAAIPK